MFVAASAFTIPALIREIGISKSIPNQNADYVLYYGSTCPHCKIVEQYIKDNDLEERLGIAEKEVYQDKNNQAEFVKTAGVCGLNQNNLGVPMLWDAKDKKCYEGDQPIINFLKKLADLP